MNTYKQNLFCFLLLLLFFIKKKRLKCQLKDNKLFTIVIFYFQQQQELWLCDSRSVISWGKNTKYRQNILTILGMNKHRPCSESHCGNNSLGQAISVCSHQFPSCQNKCVYLLCKCFETCCIRNFICKAKITQI